MGGSRANPASLPSNVESKAVAEGKIREEGEVVLHVELIPFTWE